MKPFSWSRSSCRRCNSLQVQSSKDKHELGQVAHDESCSQPPIRGFSAKFWATSEKQRLSSKPTEWTGLTFCPSSLTIYNDEMGSFWSNLVRWIEHFSALDPAFPAFWRCKIWKNESTWQRIMPKFPLKVARPPPLEDLSGIVDRQAWRAKSQARSLCWFWW